MKIRCMLIIFLLQNIGILQSGENENLGKIRYIELKTGVLPINSFPVTDGNVTTSHSWSAYVIRDNTLYLPITRGYVPDSNDALVEIDNLVFHLDELIFDLSQQSGTKNPSCGNDFAFMDNDTVLYVIPSNEKTNFDTYLQRLSDDGRMVYTLEYPRFTKEFNTLKVYNKIRDNLETVNGVKGIRFPSKTTWSGVWDSRSLKNRLAIWKNTADQNEVMILNSKEIITLPDQVYIPVASNRLSKNNKFLYLVWHEENIQKIAAYDIGRNWWDFSKEFLYIWGMLAPLGWEDSDRRCVLAYDTSRPFFVWDLKSEQEVEIKNLNALNKLALQLNVKPDPYHENWFYEFSFGANKIVLSAEYFTDEKATLPFGFIIELDKNGGQAKVFDESHYIKNWAYTTAPDEYTFVKYLTFSDEGKKLYNFAKIYLNNDRPIEWIENIEISPRFDSNYSDYYIITHQDGSQQMQQLPENNYFSATLQEYFQTPYRSSYIPQTNRVVTIQKNHKDLLESEGETNKIISCQRHRYDQEEFVIVRYQDGQIARLSTEEYESVVQEMKQIRIQQLLLDSMNSESDFDEQSKYTITVRDADSGQEQQTIFCDTYRLAETADRTIVYLVTYKQGDENTKVWYLLDKQMDNTTDDEQARRFIGGLCLLQ